MGADLQAIKHSGQNVDTVTGILPKWHALEEIPLAERYEIKPKLVQMVKKDHIE